MSRDGSFHAPEETWPAVRLLCADTNQSLLRKCLQARPGETTPIVAWHGVPGKASLERTVP
jgi:hypothetical protein